MKTIAPTMTPTPVPAPASLTSRGAAKHEATADEVGPSRVMEVVLHALVMGLLLVSIIGIAYVYGFNLQTGSLLDNFSAAIRALGVDGGFFLGLYFSRRLWMRKKNGWWDGLKTTLFGCIWFGVALLMAALSWFSNTLFVTNSQTIITQDLLTRAGFTSISPPLVNKAIGAIPLVIVLLYSIVPRRMSVQLDTRLPEEIEEEARREAARIRAQNLVAAARAEGTGQRIRTVLGGLVQETFNLEEARKRDERLKQMRIALETAGHATRGLSDEQVEIQAVARGVWNQTEDRPTQTASSTFSGAERIHPLVGNPRGAADDVQRTGRQSEQHRGAGGVIEQEPPERAPQQRRLPASPDALERAAAAGDLAPPTWPGQPEVGFTLDELADVLDVAHGTIQFWTRPDFEGPTKIYAHELTTDHTGIKRVSPDVLERLFRAHKRLGQAKSAGSVLRPQGSVPVGTRAATPSQNNHHSNSPETRIQSEK